MTTLRFKLNGREVDASGADPNTTLLAWLRERGLTGTKEGCAEGECGACAVVVVRGHGEGARYEPVNSCLFLLGSAADQEVVTVEGVADGALHPVQEAMVRLGGSQCGYCTPGFVMSLLAHYHGDRRATAVHALSGNLCRCTGYRPLRDVAERLPLPAEDDAMVRRLTRAVPDVERLHYVQDGAVFWRPTTLSEVLALRDRHPEAPLLAGGTDLVVALNQDGVCHSGWIALDGVEALRTLRRDDDHWVVGAALPLADIERRLSGAVPLLDALWPLFASPLIRARATLGGNLATASPVGDGAPVLLALEASLDLASVGGTRRLPLDAFFTGYRKTAIAADEIIEAVRVPALPPTHARFYKVTKRPLDDIASVAAAFAVHVERGRVARARLAYGGVAPTPVRAHEAEAVLAGAPWGDPGTLARVRPLLDAAFTPIDDHRASAAYRRAMVVRLFEKFWSECAEAAA